MSLFIVNLSLYFHTTESSLDLDEFFLCQTYSPSSKTSQQESDSQGHLWSSGLHHQNNILFYKYLCFSGCLKDHFCFHLPSWPFLLLQYHRDRQSLWLPVLAPHTEMRWLRPSSWSRSTSTAWRPRPTLLPHYLRLETLVCAEKIQQIVRESHF